MIRLQDVALRRGTKLLFEQASLQLHAGQRMGVTGANGSGKSSLFALLLGELEADAGEVDLPRGLRIAQVRQQSPETSRPALEYVLDGDAELRELRDRIQALETAGRHGELQPWHEQLELIDGFTAEARAGQLMHGLGFAAGDEARPVNEFSGGWRMRLNLAQALMCRSDLLLLDEPTNHLDLPAILWLERWLKRYEGMLLLISHDRDFLDNLCTHVAHIERQRLDCYTGNYSQFEAVRAERLAHQQNLYERQQKTLKHLQGYVDRFRYKASKAKQAQSRLKMMERMTRIAPAHVDSQFRFSFLEPERQPRQLLALEQAAVGYDAPILEGIRLSLQAGDRVGLLGVNGAGKSTLVKALAEGITLLSGERQVHPHTRIAYFAQHQSDALQDTESPLWHLEQVRADLTVQQARDVLGRFGFRDEAVERPVAPFSGGEKARLVLALLMLQRPNLLLLDEPTNHLDLDMRHALSMALLDYTGALVLISHDRHLLRSVCDDLYIVHDGRVEHFDDDIDHYPAWLRAREQAAQGDNGTAAPEDRKARKRREAMERARLKPLRDRVKRIEKVLETQRRRLGELDQQLADANLYQDPARQQELADLLRDQGIARRAIDDAEWEWLEASEALETAQQAGPGDDQDGSVSAQTT